MCLECHRVSVIPIRTLTFAVSGTSTCALEIHGFLIPFLLVIFFATSTKCRGISRYIATPPSRQYRTNRRVVMLYML